MVKKDDFTGDGQYLEDTNIDDTVFKAIESADTDIGFGTGVDEYTKVLMHMDESTFINSINKTPATISIPAAFKLNTDIKKFGSGSLEYITDAKDIMNVNIGTAYYVTSPLTIDFWLYIPNTSTSSTMGALFCFHAPTGYTRSDHLGFFLTPNTGAFRWGFLSDNNGGYLSGTIPSPIKGAWHHIALTN